jgi:beta-aspartyl-peptidase (threonine type)
MPVEDLDPYRSGCRAALLAGWEILRSGGSALDAVEAAVVALENDPHFNAGHGAVLNADGQVELDASIMEGERLRAGAVGAIRGISNPIRLVRKLLEADHHILLVGEGARRFARNCGIPECAEDALITEARHRQWKALRAVPSGGTVGAVALDHQGLIVAGTSTGGMAGKYAGRVGDSAVIGAGTYADSRIGGASATGLGEAIMRVALTKFAIDQLKVGHEPAIVADLALTVLQQEGRGQGGIILVDHRGRVGAAHNTPCMTHGWISATSPEPIVRFTADS